MTPDSTSRAAAFARDVRPLLHELPRPVAVALRGLSGVLGNGGERQAALAVLTALENITRYCCLGGLALATAESGQTAVESTDVLLGQGSERFQSVASAAMSNVFGRWVDLLRVLGAPGAVGGQLLLGFDPAQREPVPAWAAVRSHIDGRSYTRASLLDFLVAAVAHRNALVHNKVQGSSVASELCAGLLELLKRRPYILRLCPGTVTVARNRGRGSIVGEYHPLTGIGGGLPTHYHAEHRDIVEESIWLWDAERPVARFDPLVRRAQSSGGECLMTLLEIRNGVPRFVRPGQGQYDGDAEQITAELRSVCPYLFSQQTQPHARAHYEALVEMAMTDGRLDPGEAAHLRHLRAQLGLSDAEVREIHQHHRCPMDAEPEPQAEVRAASPMAAAERPELDDSWTGAWLTLLADGGSSEGHTCWLARHGALTLGRDIQHPEVDVVASIDPCGPEPEHRRNREATFRISSRHVTLRLRGGKALVRDRGSTNGTTVGGIVLKPETNHPLSGSGKPVRIDLAMELSLEAECWPGDAGHVSGVHLRRVSNTTTRSYVVCADGVGVDPDAAQPFRCPGGQVPAPFVVRWDGDELLMCWRGDSRDDPSDDLPPAPFGGLVGSTAPALAGVTGLPAFGLAGVSTPRRAATLHTKRLTPGEKVVVDRSGLVLVVGRQHP